MRRISMDVTQERFCRDNALPHCFCARPSPVSEFIGHRPPAAESLLSWGFVKDALRTLLSALVIFTGAAIPCRPLQPTARSAQDAGDLVRQLPGHPLRRCCCCRGRVRTDRDGNHLPTLHTDAYKKLAEWPGTRGSPPCADKRGGREQGRLSGEATRHHHILRDDARLGGGVEAACRAQCVWIAGPAKARCSPNWPRRIIPIFAASS